jgi:hypothetical protein
MKLEQQLYDINDLENLSAFSLYSISSGPLPRLPSHQLREPTPMSIESFPRFSRYESNYSKNDENPLGEFNKMMLEINKRVAEQQRERWEEERKKQQEEIQQRLINSMCHFKSESLRPASNLGLGIGLAREMSEAGNMIERIRKDDDSPSHLNYEYLIPSNKTNSGKKKWINLINLHIYLDD